MPIYAYSPELRQEFRHQHRRGVQTTRRAKRRSRDRVDDKRSFIERELEGFDLTDDLNNKEISSGKNKTQ